MKYVVEWMYGNRNEVSDLFDNYPEAKKYAIFQSMLVGVSEAIIYDEEGVELGRFVDGEAVPIATDDDWYEEDYEDDYDYDEVGYNPYTGGYDEDL